VRRGELTEETGWVAARLERLTTIVTTPGFCDEVLHLFLATGLTESPAGHRREEGESTMSVVKIPLPEAVAMAKSGEMRDAKSIIGVLLTGLRRGMQ